MRNEIFKFFRNNNELLIIYENLVRRLDCLPKLVIKKRRSYDKMVVFCKSKNFAYISLLDGNGSFLEGGFKIVFSVPHKISDPRLMTITEPHPGRYSHHVLVTKLEDIDDQLFEWLKESYDNA